MCGALKASPDGTLSPYSPDAAAARVRSALDAGEPADLPDDVDHRWNEPSLGYLAAGLSEVGDERLQGVLAHADRFMSPTWERGGLYYPRHDASWDRNGNMTYVDPLTGNVLLGYARLNVPDGLWALYNHPWGPAHFAQPRLDAIEGSLDVLRAVYHQDSRTLLLTLRGRDGLRTDAGLDIAGLPPGRPWTLYRDGTPVATRGTGIPSAPGAAPNAHHMDHRGILRLNLSIEADTTLALRWE